MPGRLTLGLVALRATAVLALLLLLWNPARSRPVTGGQQLVLLDASLSMTGTAGTPSPWRAALDTARALARGGGVIWRFGSRVAAFDSSPPNEGATRLAPALEAAAGRGGPVTVVTDGAVQDAGDIPADLRQRPRLVVVPRPDFSDAFLASVAGPRRVVSGDTLRLVVGYGTAGPRRPEAARRAAVVLSVGGRQLVSRDVTLPDSGTLATELTLPASRLPSGWSALEVRIDGAGDAEPRDDARWLVVEVSPQPAAVILASPPDWESRFLARTLGDVARVPVKTFVAAEPGRWRDGLTLAPVAGPDVQRAVGAARLIVLSGSLNPPVRLPARAAVLAWSAAGGLDGDWYVQPPQASPLAGMLAGLPWDSLPPLTSAADVAGDSGTVVLSARLGRRGAARPVISLMPGSGARRASVTAGGLWRWSFRGGAPALAYRSLVASLVDWLLGGGAASGERFAPLTFETPNGVPLLWRWTGTAAPRDVAVRLQSADSARMDTLRFDARGQAELRLPPGEYRYASPDGGERGLVVVERYSDEWRPAPPVLSAQPGLPALRVESVGLRDRWWLFVVAVAALAGEWAWRRRQGLP